MITFQRVKYQNFLATGNAPITIDLDTHASTLIVGNNGAGKSTMSEAVCFGLFGKPLRNVNKPKLVNSINQRDCLVELWFTTISGNYLVRRGIKPAIFEIYHNDILEPVPANVDDYQTHLESILKLNYKSFKQVVILGNASYVPFMRLPASGRREIIEDILDIEVFSGMNALAKEDLTEAKTRQDKCNTARRLVSEQVKMAQTFTEHLAEQKKLAITTIDDLITDVAANITALTTERIGLIPQLQAFVTVRDERDTALKGVKQYERTLDQLNTKATELRKDRDFYEQHANCPECEQVITEAFKQARFQALTQKESAASEAITQCEALIGRHRTKAETLEQTLGEATRLATRIQSIDTLLPVHRSRIKQLEAERAKLNTPQTQPNVDTDALNAQLVTLNTEHDELSRERVILDAATWLLKDNGIKTRVVKHYLPIINKHINHYLTAMDFPILFQFDEAFEESMKSRHRDEFVYELFSEGEKKRIDLALLLTWRAVAKLKNSASTNLLILDEVFDSSLDAAGIEEFLKIIQGLERDTNVVVISHHTDQLVDKFEHAILFEKHKQFSRIITK